MEMINNKILPPLSPKLTDIVREVRAGSWLKFPDSPSAISAPQRLREKKMELPYA